MPIGMGVFYYLIHPAHPRPAKTPKPSFHHAIALRTVARRQMEPAQIAIFQKKHLMQVIPQKTKISLNKYCTNRLLLTTTGHFGQQARRQLEWRHGNDVRC
jgi:hypothetical protein